MESNSNDNYVLVLEDRTEVKNEKEAGKLSVISGIDDKVEKPLYFDPFGQIEFAHFGHNIIAPCKVLVQGSILFYPFRDSGFS